MNNNFASLAIKLVMMILCKQEHCLIQSCKFPILTKEPKSELGTKPFSQTQRTTHIYLTSPPPNNHIKKGVAFETEK